MKTYSKAAQEKMALRKNSDARKFAQKGARGHVYAPEHIEAALRASLDLATDYRWLTCGGIK